MVKLSKQQLEASALIKDWYLNGDRLTYYLAGYAGTGKSTIVNEVVKNLFINNIIYCAFTGKAASVLAAKGNTPASTVHSLIYKPEADPVTNKVKFVLKDQLETCCDLIVLDECSMINQSLFDDLLSFDVPILILGDPGQLPPIKGKSPFGEPDFKLTDVHRQAKDSIILEAATHARQGNGVLLKEGNGYWVHKSNPFANKKEDILLSLIRGHKDPVQIICGRNKTRVIANNIYRQYLGYKSRLPMSGEKIICLKNNKELGLFNGQMFTFIEHNLPSDEVDRNYLGSVDCKIQDEEGCLRNLQMDMRPFIESDYKHQDSQTNPFTYGYAITCHKSQGSQWDDVIVIDESNCFQELSGKWLYTAITRAAKNLWIIK